MCYSLYIPVYTNTISHNAVYWLGRPTGACYHFFIPRLTALKTTREESQMSHFHTTLFIIVLYWCLDLIRHNIGTLLKHNKYIFDIPIPFCHNLYLTATFKQFLTEFAGFEILFHDVYMWTPHVWLVELTNQIARRNLVLYMYIVGFRTHLASVLWSREKKVHIINEYYDFHFFSSIITNLLWNLITSERKYWKYLVQSMF
jgi:hypothetical protein